MCQDCGCTIVGEIQIHAFDHAHDVEQSTYFHQHDGGMAHSHAHAGDHIHSHNGDHVHAHTLTIAQGILSKNDRLAERNRGYFEAKNLLVLNLLSSPGSGKTTLLERMARDLGDRLPLGVIVGDLATDHDALRLRNSGATAVQITTGTVCHLEADMVAQAAQHLDLDAIDLLVIENVGNLVCPAAYDLGESFRVALLSVTEGEDKPLKYPTLFKSAQVILINKIDIAEAVGFNLGQTLAYLGQVAPQATILQISARTGEGMTQWYDYLEQRCQKCQKNLTY